MFAAQLRALHFWGDSSSQFTWYRPEEYSAVDTGTEQVVYFCHISRCMDGVISPTILGWEAQLRFLLQKIFKSSSACLAPILLFAAVTLYFSYCLRFTLSLSCWDFLLIFWKKHINMYFNILYLILMDLEHRREDYECIYFEAFIQRFSCLLKSENDNMYIYELKENIFWCSNSVPGSFT